MVRILIVIMVAAVVLVASFGCGQRSPQTPHDETGDARQTATEARAEQTETRGSLPKPPNGTLAFESQRETGRLGGYCWDSVCTEASFEVPPGGEALTVPSSSDLLFEYGGTLPPSKVQAKGYALVRGKAERVGETLQAGDKRRAKGLVAGAATTAVRDSISSRVLFVSI